MPALTTLPSHMENITPLRHLYNHAIIPWSISLTMCVRARALRTCECLCVGARRHEGVRWMQSLSACILARRGDALSLLRAPVVAAPSHAAKIKHQSASLVSAVEGGVRGKWGVREGRGWREMIHFLGGNQGDGATDGGKVENCVLCISLHPSSSSSVAALRAGGCRFNPQQSQTKDHCLAAWLRTTWLDLGAQIIQ